MFFSFQSNFWNQTQSYVVPHVSNQLQLQKPFVYVGFPKKKNMILTRQSLHGETSLGLLTEIMPHYDDLSSITRPSANQGRLHSIKRKVEREARKYYPSARKIDGQQTIKEENLQKSTNNFRQLKIHGETNKHMAEIVVHKVNS